MAAPRASAASAARARRWRWRSKSAALCSSSDSLSQIKRWAEEQLPLELVRRWRERVDRSLAPPAVRPGGTGTLDSASRGQVEAHPYLAYGSTLLAVIVAPTFILYLQLGDGDILTVSASGEVERPLAKDRAADRQ